MGQFTENVADYISKLAGADAKEREEAAYALFRLGCASAEPVLRKWLADPEFRALAAGGNALLTVGLAVQPATFETIRQRFGQPQLAEAPPDQTSLQPNCSNRGRVISSPPEAWPQLMQELRELLLAA